MTAARITWTVAGAAGVLVASMITGAPPAAADFDGPVELISVDLDGDAAADGAFLSKVSDNGRFVAFESQDPNLVEQDHGQIDVFVRDRDRETTTRVTVSSSGVAARGRSSLADISANGRYVLFHSRANNLVQRDANRKWDVFVHDLRTGKTRRVSKPDRRGQAKGDSFGYAISGNGRIVAFTSDAPNLVRRDTNGTRDVFIRNLRTHRTKRVSVNSREKQSTLTGEAPQVSMSDNGRFVAFTWKSDDVMPSSSGAHKVYLRDRARGRTKMVARTPGGGRFARSARAVAVAPDGAAVAFAIGYDDRAAGALYTPWLWVRGTGRTELVSVRQDGRPLTGASSAQISVSNGGRYVVFTSFAAVTGDEPAADAFDGDNDVFVRDRATKSTVRVSLPTSGDSPQGSGGSFMGEVSATGAWVGFATSDIGLVPGGPHTLSNVVVRARTH